MSSRVTGRSRSPSKKRIAGLLPVLSVEVSAGAEAPATKTLGETIPGSLAPAPGLMISRAVPRSKRRQAATAQPHRVGSPVATGSGGPSPPSPILTRSARPSPPRPILPGNYRVPLLPGTIRLAGCRGRCGLHLVVRRVKLRHACQARGAEIPGSSGGCREPWGSQESPLRARKTR
jgi:hypothetical protein